MDRLSANIHVRGQEGTIRCSGSWTLHALAGLEQRIAQASFPVTTALVCDVAGITSMDTGGAVLLHRMMQHLEQDGRKVELSGLQPDFTALMELVTTHWGSVDLDAPAHGRNWIERLGDHVWRRLERGVDGVAFLGESTVALVRSLGTPGTIRWRELFGSLEADGFRALPIVGLLLFLMGVVIAYQGAEQLESVGANIFVVDLVGISLLREIAPLVTAILIAGRSGSAFTAQIGTMKVTEELDALRVLGLSPINMLVLPKVLALVIALPLLTVYADIVGVFGGMLIAAGQLGVSFNEFLTRFEEAVVLRHFLIGIGKAPVFAIIIALVGCYQGFQIRGGVDDVGQRTTISVVQSIFLVIVFDAAFSIVLNWWNL